MSSRPLKLRFAPSPTGFLHVGGARTAIFNLLHARRHGGSFLLRIEDTDVERSRQHHAEQIVSSLHWLGVEWDEGPIYQSDRIDRYRMRAEELLEKGAAYRCYCTVEELEAERLEAESAGHQYRYSGKCRDLAAHGISRSGPSVIRFRVSPGPIEFRDLIRGDVRFEADLIDDFVLIRSDGNPTYHLSVVVDDIDMEVTVVARGEDHLSNTPKHILLFRAFEADVPDFAHVPLILGPDKKRLSKRTGATSVEEYQKLGILPEALFNFLLLLGWATSGDREIISRDEAIDLFDLTDVNKSAAVFDMDKLYWINGQYMQKMTPEQLEPHLRPFLSIPLPEGDDLIRVLKLNQTRARSLVDLAELVVPYFYDAVAIEYEADAVKKHVKGEELKARMEELRDAYATLDPFDVETTERVLRGLAESSNLGAGKYIHPLRVALTGKMASPPIFDVAVALGRERTLDRLNRFIGEVDSLRSSGE
ncbi:MAG: glutamate--tRNA ligase [Thermoanaerobaculia bacterium]